MVRTKFRVVDAGDIEFNGAPAKNIHLVGVYDGQMGKDGNQCKENAIFGKYTPSAQIQMVITNPEASEKFKPGSFKYVDFTDAE